ncbi:MAG: single-stranded DNA-binding protein [Candidatus Dormibacteria bacterium]
MSGNLNRAQVIGRLTRDPEMRYTATGTAMTKLGLATNSYGSGADGERKEYTDYHNVVVWNQGKRNLAELCAQYLKKGSLVYVEGRLQTRSWEGPDGQKRQATEINATDVQFLESRTGGGGGGGSQEGGAFDDDFAATPPAAGGAPRPAAVPVEGDIDPDDIPF